MSEVISLVKDSPDNAKGSSQSPKTAIAAALITAVTTVLVSFMGIMPQLRRGDVEELTTLKRQIEALKQPVVAPVLPAGADKKLSVSGKVTTPDGKRPLNGIDVFLLPEGNNVLAGKTDDEGNFTLPGIPAGTYSIIIRDSAQGRSGKILLDETESEMEMKMIGAKIKYLIR